MASHGKRFWSRILAIAVFFQGIPATGASFAHAVESRTELAAHQIGAIAGDLASRTRTVLPRTLPSDPVATSLPARATTVPAVAREGWTARPALAALVVAPPSSDGADPSRLPPSLPSLPRTSAGSVTASPRAAAGAATLSSVAFLGGWNLASLPNTPQDRTPGGVFGALAGGFTRVYAYDACDPSDPWKLYDPADAGASDLTSLDEQAGFWIEATGAGSLPTPGTQPVVSTIHLCAGWNLVGYPLAQPRGVATALSSIAGRYSRVFGYDPADPADPWEVYDVAVPSWANDLVTMQPGRGYWIYATADADLTLENAGAAPEVAITSPEENAVVFAPTEIRGSIRSSLLDHWTLSVRKMGGSTLRPLATGTSPQVDAVLATLDTTLLQNGLYELVLEATDVQGLTSSIESHVVVAGQQKIGHFSLSFVDLEIPLSGLPIQVVRTYDSRDLDSGDFGAGWNLELRQGSYRNNRKPGDGWQFANGFLPCDTVGETRAHLTTIRLSDRELYRFKLSLARGAETGGGCFSTARFDFVDGPVPGARLAILGNDQVFYANGGDQVVDTNSFELYEPRQVRFTARDGRVFDLDLVQGVTRVADANGNEVRIGPSSLTHSSGVAITFERDGQGRITRIADGEGVGLDYGYDAAGDLVSVTDREAKTSRFTYAAHYLTDIQDARGVTPLRNEYDASGRLVRHVDAFGKEIRYDHDLAARTETVTDRLGHSRLLAYDERGNVVREVDANGKETTRTFDARDNLMTETDPLGHATTYTYTQGNLVASITDPLQHTTSFTYDARGNVLTTTDPRGKVTTNTYDAAGNLLTTEDPLHHTTTYTYDVRGNLRTETDAVGGLTEYTYDGRGNVVAEKDALGHLTTSTYDGNGNRRTQTTTRTTPTGIETLTTRFAYDRAGRLTSTTDPDSSVSKTEYDALGNVAATVDKLGRRTTFHYDALGRQDRTDYPDATFETRTYDDEGRLLTTTDRGGRTTTSLYDAVGRLVKTTYADTTFTESVYDDSGRLVESRDPLGHSTRYRYDDAGRRTKVIDALQHETLFEYDAAGNQTAVTDARGKVTRFTYDDAGRLTRTTYPDGTHRDVGYDELGRRVSESDQAGITTAFGYDALGRLLTVTDALDQVTRYAYDELGNRTSQTDANQHQTRFEYDALGRQTRRVLPDGAAESFAYDTAGNLDHKVTFGGVTIQYAYDAVGRLLSRTFPGGGAGFTYTATDQRRTALDARGTTLYEYDARGRLKRLVYPDGRELGYGYDAAGNRTSLSATVGGTTYTTAYAYDVLNRLERITDPNGKVTTYSYDENGNRAGVDYANGVATRYTYDDLNRLTDLATARAGDGAVVQSYHYTLGDVGNRTAVDEQGGTAGPVHRAYSYDSLYRLTHETVSRAAAQAYAKVFTYDPVGNRLRQEHTDAAGVTSAKTYAYDTRDRTESETGEASVAYGWDVDGRLTTKTGADGASYVWDAEDRLLEVDLANGTVVRHTYDVDGVRVRTVVTPSGGGGGSTGAPQVTEYLVDTAGALSQVVAEGADAGSVSALYVRGDDLVAAVRGGETRYFHADGLGSVRALTDEAGNVTDRYDFTAFGEFVSHEGDDPNAYLFAGEPLDPNSGWYYNRARWMDPESGRFATSDPIAGRAGLLRLMVYGYANADPADQSDPSGLFATLGNLITPALVGRAVHAAIGAHFMSAPRMPGAKMGIRYANDFSISTIVGIPNSSCWPEAAFCDMQPDLVDTGTGEVYEIKSNRTDQILLGIATLDMYLGILWVNGFGKAPWHGGVAYQPLRTFQVTVPGYGTWAIQTYGPMDGIITYDARRLRRWQLPTPDPVTISTLATSSLMLAISVAMLNSLRPTSFGF